MPDSLEPIYKMIAESAIACTRGLSGKLLIYAEVEEGAVSADLFYESVAGDVRFRFAPNEMKDLIYSFWKLWKDQPGQHEWRTMAYVLNGSKFDLGLKYPDQIRPDEDVSERRPAEVKKQFGETRVDYTHPNG